MYQGDKLAVLFGNDRLGNELIAVEHLLDIFGVDVLARWADNHILKTTLDIYPALVIDVAKVAGAEPAILGKGCLCGLLVSVIALHTARCERNNLALLGLGVNVVEANLYGGERWACRADTHHIAYCTRDKGSGLGKAIADTIGEARLKQEALSLRVELRATDGKKTHTATK